MVLLSWIKHRLYLQNLRYCDISDGYWHGPRYWTGRTVCGGMYLPLFLFVCLFICLFRFPDLHRYDMRMILFCGWSGMFSRMWNCGLGRGSQLLSLVGWVSKFLQIMVNVQWCTFFYHNNPWLAPTFYSRTCNVPCAIKPFMSLPPWKIPDKIFCD